MLKLNNITFSYGEKNIFKDFSLNIQNNNRIWIYGESGCGKTTLIRLILGLEKAQSGDIVTEKKLKPSVVFQENRLLPFKTALENILIVSADKNKAIENLKALGLEKEIDTNVSELSGGMKRRVAIARALSVDFDYLILDEAFTGMDMDNIKLAVALILKIAKDKPILLITHSPAEAELLNAQKIKL